MSPEEEEAGEEDPQARAMRRAATLWAEDACARGLGMVIVEVAPGRAVLELTIAPSMANGHGTAHGGIIFTLADSAFAFAANSGAEDHVAEHAQMSFLRPVAVGERLRAEARARHHRPGAGLFDVTVTNAEGEVVAEFRGHSRVRGAVPGDAPS
ncbi:MAG: hydroxyphenylacetyl-CoA thioesterase PaaI [Alphaproteobacteria bacterium]